MSQRKNPFKDLGEAPPIMAVTHVQHHLPLSPSIPPGCKVIIVKQEFKPEILNQISLAVDELSKIKAVQTVEEAESANTHLKRAKGISKNIETERLLMTSVLDQEKKSIMDYAKGLTATLDATIAVVTASVTQFQQREAKRIADENAKIQKDRDEKFAKEQKEIREKAEHKQNLLDLERAIVRRGLETTLKNVDENIEIVSAFEINADFYGEHVAEANKIVASGIVMFQKKKASLALAPNACVMHDKASEEAIAAIEAKQLAAQEEEQEALQSAALNIQMDAELKTAQIGKQKGIAKVWVFEEDAIDLALLPLEFHTFDKAKIKAAIAAGRTEIPGVIIKQDIRNVAR
jgi:hypothetical protein